ncbi:hypothetical protein D3C85_905560 [compost metagenome]
MGDTGGRETGDAPRLRLDEPIQFGIRHGAVDPAVALGGIGIEVGAAQAHFQGAAAAEQLRQAHRATGTRQQADRDFRLAQHAAFTGGETHIQRQEKFAAGPAGATAQRAYGHLRQAAVTAEQGAEQTGLALRQRRRGLAELTAEVVMGQEELRVGAAEDHHAGLRIALQGLDQVEQIDDQLAVHQVDWRVVEANAGHAVMVMPGQGAVGAHEYSPRWIARGCGGAGRASSTISLGDGEASPSRRSAL